MMGLGYFGVMVLCLCGFMLGGWWGLLGAFVIGAGLFRG